MVHCLIWGLLVQFGSKNALQIVGHNLKIFVLTKSFVLIIVILCNGIFEDTDKFILYVSLN